MTTIEEAIARAERAEAEADSLRATIDNMRAMNIKLTFEASGKVLAAEAKVKELREALTKTERALDVADAFLQVQGARKIARAALQSCDAPMKDADG